MAAAFDAALESVRRGAFDFSQSRRKAPEASQRTGSAAGWSKAAGGLGQFPAA